MTTTAITFYGMSQFVGATATVTIVGLDCGDYTVAADGSVTVPYGSDPDGSVTVPYGSDPDGLLTADYLIALSANPPSAVYGWGELAATFQVTSSLDVLTTVTLPAVVGFNYTSDGQAVRPATQDDIRSPLGTGLGKTRRNHMFGTLLAQTQGIAFGSDFSNLRTAQFQTDDGTAYPSHTLFNGVFQDEFDDDYSFDGMIAWRIARPYPATVASLTGFLSTQDR